MVFMLMRFIGPFLEFNNHTSYLKNYKYNLEEYRVSLLSLSIAIFKEIRIVRRKYSQ